MLGHAAVSELPVSGFAPASASGVYTLTCDAGSFTLTGQDAALVATRIFTADAGSFTLTGQAATFAVTRTLACDAGAFTLTGQAALFTYTQSGGGGDPGYGYRPGEYDDQDVAIAERHRHIMRLRDEAEQAEAADQERIDLFLSEQEALTEAKALVARAIDRLPAIEAAEAKGDQEAVQAERRGLEDLLGRYSAIQRVVLADRSAETFRLAQRQEFERLVRLELERLSAEEAEFIELLMVLNTI